MSDEIVHLKAELYDISKKASALGSIVDQLAAVLAVNSVQALYEEVLRLKQLELDTEKVVFEAQEE